jgi:hypothetical protein
MQENFNDTDEQIESKFFPALFSFFENEISLQLKFVKDAENIYSNFSSRLTGDSKRQEELRVIKEINNTNNHLYKLLGAYYPEKRENGFAEDFKSYITFCNQELKQVPEKVTIPEKEERFHIQPTDSVGIKFKKPFKSFFRATSNIPVKIADVFRKEKKGEKVWLHDVPVRGLYSYFFEFQLPYSLIEEYSRLLSSRTQTIDQVWKIDQFINQQIAIFNKEEISIDELKKLVADRIAPNNFQNIYNELNKLSEVLQRELKYKLQIQTKEYRFTFDRVGTMEIPFAEFSDTKIQSKSASLHLNYLRISNGWKNTLYAMLDDFQLDLELYNVVYAGLQQHELLRNSCVTRIDNNLVAQISTIEKNLKELKHCISTSEQFNGEKFANFLTSEKDKLNVILTNQVIPEAIEKLYSQNIPYLIERLETKIKTEIDKIQPQRIISGSAQYDRAFKKNELEHFDPKELVQLETYPRFISSNKDLKSSVLEKLEAVRTAISDINSIVTYNLDSAITYSNDGKPFEEVQNLALEGMERSIAKTEEIKNSLIGISTSIVKKLDDTIDDLNKELDRLTKNENILNLRISLARAKALRHTQNYKQIAIEFVKKYYYKVKAYTLVYWGKATVLYGQGLKYFGLNEKKVRISAELADFLSDTDKAIEQLPYVYQRLYRVEPIDDESFFVGRSTELTALNKAFNNWQLGKYSSTVITGEKGSGSSTLINFFLKSPISMPTHRIKANRTLYKKSDLIDFFNDFMQTNATSFDELTEQLISNHSNSLIILEDINYLFLKKVNGFDALKAYLELISKTGKYIFWINSCKLYAWQFLNKSLRIESYYRNVLQMSNIDENQINKIIINRHRVSGYNIHFEESQMVNSQNKYNKLSDLEKQEYLRKEFFKELNKFSDSNISIALLYWLRSTKKVEKNTIYIGKLSGFDFSFLNNLEKQSIHSLYAMIIHENLGVEEHAILFNNSIEHSRLDLIVLEDRGIIIKNNEGLYHINQLLFRQVVNLLKNLNIIH